MHPRLSSKEIFKKSKFYLNDILFAILSLDLISTIKFLIQREQKSELIERLYRNSLINILLKTFGAFSPPD